LPHKAFFSGSLWIPSNKKEILKGILAKRKLYPEQVLMVGDALTDWECAQGVGAEFIGIQSGKSSNIFPSTNILQNNFINFDKFVYPC
jgi:phosphoglycolate phosphatase-like HAD superfamily hydrolase